MALPTQLIYLADWIRAQLGLVSEAAYMLIGAGILIALFVLFWVLRVLLKIVRSIVSALTTSSRIRKAQTGYRILVAPPASTGRSTFKFLQSAAENHLSAFSFDAPLQVFRTGKILGGRDAQSEKVARKRLKRTGADMIVWGERVGRGSEGLNIFTLSRAGGLTPDEAVLQHFALPSSSRRRGEPVERVAAYLLAKRLQPSLGRPSDFRAERLVPVAEQLGLLLETANELSPRIQYEVERDFSAVALHVGEADKGDVWLDRVIDLRLKTLRELGDAPQPGIWAEAKLDLGRAMITKASRRFNPSLVTEGSEHLRQAVEVLKAEPSIRRAEDAMQTLDLARELTANRNRFSINFNG